MTIRRTRIPPKPTRTPRHLWKPPFKIADSIIANMLISTSGNKSECARRLGIRPETVYNRIKNSESLRNLIEMLWLQVVDSAGDGLKTKIDEKNLKACMFALEKLDRSRFGTMTESEQVGLPKGDLIINVLCIRDDGRVTKTVFGKDEEPKEITLDPSEYRIEGGKIKLREDNFEEDKAY